MKKLRAVAALGIALTASAGVARSQGVSVDLPLGVGFHVPSYDRVDGVSLPFGPVITFGEDRMVIEPLLTYRSHLGKIDPALSFTSQIARDSSLGVALFAERGTFTNEEWIRSDLLNSLETIGLGHDAHNYFRADRGEARLTSRLRIPIDAADVFIGARVERAWSTGWRAGELHGPYSVFGRRDSVDGVQRPNPEINRGHITSAIAGVHFELHGLVSSLAVRALLEASAKTPMGGNFQQLTFDEMGTLSTFAGQRLVVGGHLLATHTSSLTPAQRYSYVGGSGTLATVDLLSLGGDHLYFIDSRYEIPVPGVDLPLVGQPYIAPRFAAGSAGVGNFGRVEQNIGVRVGAGFVAADFVVNPRSRKRDYGVGLSLSR